MALLNALRNQPPMRRHLVCAIGLLPVFAGIHYAAYWLRFEGNLGDRGLHALAATILWAVAIKFVIFGWFRVYQGWNSYVTFHDLQTLAQASTVSAGVLALADYLLVPGVQIPRSVFVFDWGATIVLVGGLRSVARMIVEQEGLSLLTGGSTPVLIVGANDSGEALLRSIRRSPRLSYRVVGFIAEDPAAIHSRIGGIPVIGCLEQTCQLAKQYKVPEVLIAAGELSGRQVRALVEDGRQRNVSVKVLPSYEQLLHGQISLQPRTVSIEDLLRREPVQMNLRELHRWIDDRVLLVTGSAGSIGSEICRQLLQFSPRKLVLVDRSETGQFFLERELRCLAPDCDIEVCLADINDRVRLARIFEDHRPDIVFHAAAYKHVPLMEQNPGEAVKNISLATRMLANLAHEQKVESFVMISTDKAVNPTSVMGTCKRVAELYVQGLSEYSDCRFVTVRFGNVLDSAGSVIPVFREQIAGGGPVTVTHPEMRRYFMTIPEASQLVIQAGAMGRGGEIFVLDMGEPVRIVDLAADMIRLSGMQVGRDIEIEFVGMRPGEKLYEELLVDGETHLPTEHPKIMVAESDKTNLTRLMHLLDRLEQSADGPADSVLDLLQNIVPQYQPQPGLARRGRRRAA